MTVKRTDDYKRMLLKSDATIPDAAALMKKTILALFLSVTTEAASLD